MRLACARGPVALLLAAGALLSGCSDNAYEKRDGRWHYNGNPIEVAHAAKFTPLNGANGAMGPFAKDSEVAYYRGAAIPGSDGPSFSPLDEHYARDKARAYFCDTYRKGQEYYTAKHNHIVVMEGVALGSFRLLTQGYARDGERLYYEGAHVPVRDLESFELLENNFQRDRVTGYFMRRPIAGSDGSTFAVIDAGYSKDKAGVYFSHYRSQDVAPRDASVRVKGASPDTFVVKGAGYAVDARQAYHNGRPISGDAAGFQKLASLYAKTGTVVFFDGRPIPAADAASFVVLERDDGEADARDARRRYRHGEARP